jgi:hypothetical protein
VWWCTLIIPAIQKAEMGGPKFEITLGEKVREILSQKASWIWW